MTPLRFITGLLLLSGLLLTGCQTRPPMGEITSVVDAIKLTSANGDRGIVTLRYANENIVPVSFASSTHVLSLNGNKVAEINDPKPLGLAQLTSTTRDFPVDFTNPTLMRELDHAVAGYRLDSVLLTQSLDKKEKIKGNTSGHVTINGGTK